MCGYCWWTALRSGLPPDTVAARFERAFTTLGFIGATRTRGADTAIFDDKETAWEPVAEYALAHAGPSPLPGEPAGVTFEGWAVAWVRSDTTRIRYYLARTPRDSTPRLDLCRALWSAAMRAGSAP
jgi:hypothetical protein